MYCCNHSSQRICGSFADPVNPDLGQCFPYREKRDCEAPVLPVAECSDDIFTVDYDPDLTPAFRILSRLFDSNCDPITDVTADPITAQSV